MSEGITDAELRELIAATRERRQDTGGGSPGAPALSYDFRRPQSVNKDQTRRIESIHEQFARLFSATLSYRVQELAYEQSDDAAVHVFSNQLTRCSASSSPCTYSSEITLP